MKYYTNIDSYNQFLTDNGLEAGGCTPAFFNRWNKKATDYINRKTRRGCASDHFEEAANWYVYYALTSYSYGSTEMDAEEQTFLFLQEKGLLLNQRGTYTYDKYRY